MPDAGSKPVSQVARFPEEGLLPGLQALFDASYLAKSTRDRRHSDATSAPAHFEARAGLRGWA